MQWLGDGLAVIGGLAALGLATAVAASLRLPVGGAVAVGAATTAFFVVLCVLVVGRVPLMGP